ncbi:MAG: hypothetical protein H6R18_621 [Proteobacteria bacterium]|nr:hypothetical protein [Pseudomonadota bacterium]
MRRRVVVISLIVAVLAGLAVTWFYLNFEEVTVKTRTRPEAEARRNPYLALERFFVRMGRPVERRTDARFLDALPAGGVLILDAGRRAHLTPERLTKLLAWVEQGGYLIVSPDLPGNDLVLAHFGVSRFVGGNITADDDEEVVNENAAADPASTSCPAKDNRAQVLIPGTNRPLFAAHQYQRLQAEKSKPIWQAGTAESGAQYLHFAHGGGQVTIIAALSRQFNNTNIGAHDHAEILWTLVQTYQPQLTGPISLMTRLEIPTLWQWLAESAWTAVIAGLALLLLWLWRVVPRFGAPLPDPEPDRRQLREHLTAIGRHIWRSGGLDYWLSVAREAFLARLALRHPALAVLPPVEQAEALARLTLRPAAMIADALYKPAGSISSFTSAMRTLQNLERSL